jgi:hypothetical protein
MRYSSTIVPKTCSRLLGIWKSDRKRTSDEAFRGRRVSERRRKAFAKLFGILRVTYTRTRIHSEFDGPRETARYEILAMDEHSVAIRTFDSKSGKPEICHIHFEGESRYWISLGGFREFFRRIRPRK